MHANLASPRVPIAIVGIGCPAAPRSLGCTTDYRVDVVPLATSAFRMM